MKYTVTQTINENDKSVIPQGAHKFEVIRAEEALSKNKNAMIKLTLRLGATASNAWVTDYLNEKAPRKIMHFMQSIGLGDLYEKGDISPEDCLGMTGVLKVVQEYSEQYGIQNVVSQYLQGVEHEDESA